MATAPDPITSPPPQAFQSSTGYDATAEGPVGGWDDAGESGACDSSGHASADFESGPGKWEQT